MNKQELIDNVQATLGSTKTHAAEALNAVLKGIEAGLVDSGEVTLAGFGTFNVRHRAARLGRNPSTGDPVDVPASSTVGLKPGKALKAAVNS